MSNQTDSVSKHQMSPPLPLADISYAYPCNNRKMGQGQALLLALCHLAHISRLNA